MSKDPQELQGFRFSLEIGPKAIMYVSGIIIAIKGLIELFGQ